MEGVIIESMEKNSAGRVKSKAFFPGNCLEPVANPSKPEMFLC